MDSPPQAGVRELARETGLPPLLARLLWRRGICDPQAARAFLRPDLAGLTPPQGFQDLDQAAERVAQAVMDGQVLGIAGDYDADGVTATALLVDFLSACGAKVVWDLPHRLDDGYGFSPGRAERLGGMGVKVVVTVDCGISDHEGVARAAGLGMEVVVTDHHQVPPGPLVPAHSVVNPQRADCGFAPHLAGVGVAFYLAAAVRARLRREGHFGDAPVPNLRRCLDLVALGTMADVVPLVDGNRILVSQGIKVINEGGRPGLEALCRVAGIRPGLGTRDLSFGLAPRLNAAGRLDHPRLALELLLAEEGPQASELALELDRLNQERREVERVMLEEALEEIESDPETVEAACLVLAREGWHRGVLGIVASRLVEKTGRPVVMLSLENGKAQGSGRSLEGFHLQKALNGLAGHLIGYGGHAMAVGLRLNREEVPALRRGLDLAARQFLPGLEASQALRLEEVVDLRELGPEIMEPLEALAPFGPGNPEPVLGALARVVDRRVVGENHLKMTLADPSGAGGPVPAIAFRQAFQPVGPGDLWEVAFTPRVSDWGGRHLELVVTDMRLPGEGFPHSLH